MWLSRSALERIRELEGRLAESVPRAVYESSLARIAALERRVDWQADMLLRRGGTYPLPPEKPTADVPAEAPSFAPTETDIEKARAIREAGRAAGAAPDEIAAEIRQQTGWNESDIAEAVRRERAM